MIASFKRVALGLLLASSAGCVGTRVSDTMINRPPHPMWQRPPETVEIYASSSPTRPHVDVGYLEARQANTYADKDTETFITTLRSRAAELGCDALVLRAETNEAIRRWDGRASSLEGMTAVCVVYTDSDASGRVPLAATARTAKR